MTTAPLRLVADDLTGALDSAAGFAAPSAPVPVVWREPGHAGGSVAISIETREATEAEARARTADALRWILRQPGEALVFKKVDSLLRGHPAAELAVMIELWRPDRVVLAPAHPVLGRVTRGGRQHARHGAAAELAAIDVDLAAALAARGVDVAVRPAGESGAAHVSLFDAESAADLAAIVARERAAGGRILWCGSGGLADALAGGVPAPRARPGGTTLAVIGSDHTVAAAQVRAVAERDPAALIPFDAGSGPREIARAVAARFAENVLAANPLAILVPALPPVERAAAARLIARSLGAILAAVPRPDLLYASGGETLRAVCDGLGSDGLLAEGFVAPGVPLSRLSGGRWPGIAVLSKSGGFGTASTLVTLFGLDRPRPAGLPQSHTRDPR